tara:strand:+ start:2343 stop:2603 length:261 start_codon:yes stop_codon:yes gene_type:complete
MLFELKNETNDEMLDIMSPHARGSGSADKQMKHQSRRVINTNDGGNASIHNSIRKRNNSRKDDGGDIYAEKTNAEGAKANSSKKDQ